MSELKALWIPTRSGNSLHCYIKSEADKVIAELEGRIADGDRDFELANHQNEMLLKIVRHNKYKRCLAMAKWCEERSSRYDVLQEKHDLDWSKEIEFYYRWYMRWLELAEEYK